MGMVQHYFASKNEMLLFALDTLKEHLTQRVGQRISDLPDPTAPHALVRTMLLEMLPLDEERRADALVGFAFLAQAAVRPKVAGVLHENFAQLEQFISEQIRLTQQAGIIGRQGDPERETMALLALVDGLTLHVLAGQRDAKAALALVDQYLDRLFSTDSGRPAESSSGLLVGHAGAQPPTDGDSA
jgi:AcrR family transcriptional regulator